MDLRRRALLVAVLAMAGLVTLAAPSSAGGGGHPCSAPLTDAAGTAVSAEKNCFTPTVTRIAQGDTVTWTSQDPVPHTVTPVAGGFPVTGEKLHASGEVTATFERPGVFPYVCLLHPTMAGVVVVGDAVGDAAAASVGGAATASATVGLAAAGAGILLLVAGPALLRRRRAHRAG